MKNSSTDTISIPGKKKARLIDVIRNSGEILKKKIVTAGFDGFVDSLAKVIKEKNEQNTATLFSTIEEFGNYILEKKGASFSLELSSQSIKLGGNMPIMANALGKFGMKVSCIGALGYPQPEPIFNFPPNCQLYSFANPGSSTALEFTDGKMLLGDMGALNTTGWEEIKNRIGIETLDQLFKESDLICLLNWSEIDASTDIWKGLLKAIFPSSSFEKRQTVFVDLSDCSKRSTESINEALQLLKEFGQHSKVILSLNKNEAGVISRTLSLTNDNADPVKTAAGLFEKLEIHELVLHSSKETLAVTKGNVVSVKTFYTSNPKISTGAGDNFNAGFCTAQLLQLDIEESLWLANAFSGYYVREGKSADANEIINFFENY
ncbi:PfkB family carbohydrate kinase [Terrimonas pollutisoli]|uniref:PfkB family carbohydrate kinase n=1 Tax=Terrimonas pollutisoli TaxID=3034147 RepID=UPI0023EDAB7C|nr:PfkB family carbohydrate kinase [Terrimonas sp. H1YJ31]